MELLNLLSNERAAVYIDNSCVGCGVCGSNAHSAVLCPSFVRVDLVFNPSVIDRVVCSLREKAVSLLSTDSAENQL